MRSLITFLLLAAAALAVMSIVHPGERDWWLMGCIACEAAAIGLMWRNRGKRRELRP